MKTEAILSSADRAAIIAKVVKHGLSTCASESFVSDFTLLKAAAGLPCKKGTISLIRTFIKEKEVSNG